MPAEFEELKLQVALQDDASAGLAQLRRELQQLQNTNRGFMDAQRRHMMGVAEFTKVLGLELRGAQRSFEGLAQHLGG